jgi:hypothetical protein
MSVLQFITAHWVEGTVGVAGAVLAWLATNLIGGPLIKFWTMRQKVLETINEHEGVDYRASQDRVSVARVDLRQAAAKVLAYAHGGPLIVTIYCRLRHYDLLLAGKALWPA